MSRGRLLALGLVAVVVLAVGYYVVDGGNAGGDATITRRLQLAGVDEVPCPAAQSTDPADPSGVTAVLVDRSASVRGPGAVPDYVADLRPLLQDAVDRDHEVVVAGFDGTTSGLHWSTVRTTFAGDTTRRQVARTAATDCLLRDVQATVDGPPEHSDTDVLGALALAAEVVSAAPAGQRGLVVATDGLATTGCADLDDISVGADVAAVVQRCARALPRLTGTAVTMLGVGESGPSQPAPRDTTQRAWLDSLWTALCEGTDATDCRSARNSRERGGTTGADRPDARVTWPEVTVERRTDRVTVTLPDGLLFDTDSSVLRPDAQAALAHVAEQVRDVRGSVREVVGHTDGRGEPERNRLLSLARAQQVSDALAKDYGVPAAQVRGAGESEPRCTPETRPDGRPDTAALQCNRRVEVVVGIAGQT